MAFLEGKLQPIDLLAALQARRQFEESQRGNAERERQQQLQNELLKQQIQKNEDVRGLALGQGGFPYTSAMSNSASIGYPEYRLNQERQLALSQLTGQPLPNQGITGYGGGGRYGGMGGGQDAVAPSGMNYIGPDHSAAPDVATAAQNLGNVMAGVREPGPSPITDLLAAEQGNVAGVNSLVNQAINRGLGEKFTGADMTEGMTPTADKLKRDSLGWNEKIDTWMKSGSTVPPSAWPEEIRNTAANIKTQQKEYTGKKEKEANLRGDRRKDESETLAKYQRELFSLPEWRGTSNIEAMPQDVKNQVLMVLPGFIMAARNRGQEPDIRSLIEKMKVSQ